MNYKVLTAVAISAILVAIVFSGTNIPYPGHNPTDRLVTGTGNGHGHSNSSLSGNHALTTGQNFTLSGNASNFYNKLPVNGTITISNSNMSRTLNISRNGSYSITLPRGSYSISYSSPGFDNYTTSIYLKGNTSKNISILPAYSIGTGINEFSGKSAIDTNSANVSSLIPYLNDSAISGGLNSNNITGILNKNITIELGKKLNNTNFLILIKQSGAIYTYNGITNDNGNGNLSLKYSGNYTMAAYTLYYNSSFVKYSTANGIHPIKFNMTERMILNSTIMLKSSVPLNGNASVGESYLSGYGGIFSISPAFIRSNSTGTYYGYSTPSGIYRFSYSNSNYAPNNFNLNIVENSTYKETVNPYLISVNITDNTGKLYNYSLDGAAYTLNGTYRATSGINELSLDVGGKNIYSKSIMIGPADPYYKLNMTIQYNNVTINGTETDSSNLILTYSGHITSNTTITALDFKNFTTSNTSGTITILGNYTGILAGNTYEYNLTTPINVSPGDIAVKLVYFNDSTVDKIGPISVEIYGYNVSASGNYITE